MPFRVLAAVGPVLLRRAGFLVAIFQKTPAPQHISDVEARIASPLQAAL
jgi:hypothetical protein